MSQSDELVLIDLSSIAYPIWMMSASQPDPNHCCTQIVARIRALANNHPHAAICCDSGRSFRNEVSPAYKANRPERQEALHHQIRLAKEQLVADGFPVWSVRGFEADDLIATAVTRALAIEGASVLIISSDKDLLQLVGPRVRAMSARDGSSYGPDEVVAKFGVAPSQMRDYLTLVGDASDNVKGAKNIGQVKAAALLNTFETLDAVYKQINETAGAKQNGIPPAVLASLREFEPHLETTRKLITLRTDVDLPFEEIACERVPREALTFDTFGVDDMDDVAADVEQTPEEPTAPAGPQPVERPADPSTALAVRGDVAEVLPAPDTWERGLDPRSMKEARILAKDMFDSRMFSAYGTPQGVLATVMVGRELGMPAMASLRSIHNIEGKHSLAASLMVALVLKSGMAEYFEPVSFSDTEATFETHRKGFRNPVRLTHTFEMAKQAWPKTKTDWEKSFLASGWGRNPTDMLVARATSRLARMVYPDLLAGLYTPEELLEIRDTSAAA